MFDADTGVEKSFPLSWLTNAPMRDIIIFVSIILIAAVGFLCVELLPSAGKTAVIEQNGTVAARLSLDKDTTYDVKIDGKTTNTVVIKNHAVSVSYADCPDKICKNHKSISKSGETIVCLPNKVTVTVEGGENEIDGVAK